ncbi:MAG: nucleotidyltransferase domain-containing protein [Nanoarchaeota archaeon]|nr:nucleotidyltransferase domain-containing protein [Nanoarchaeota archaeon]MBU1854606.1 nucleotidyltransferase domain-containing protein [Nanoarchaeota archaeon]
MLKKDNIYKVLEIFFDDPLPEGIGFQLREIGRKIKLAPKSVKLYLKELEKEKLIIKKEHRIHKYPVYYANRDNNYFKFLKRLNIIRRIKESGLLDYLDEKCMPDVIILFGSASKGEDVKGSDIDFYLQCDEKKLDLSKYEKELDRKLNLFFEKNFDKLSEELKTNIINGGIIKGYLRCKFYYDHLKKR